MRQWGNSHAPKLFLLHGWMDISASFQFVVEHLQKNWHVIAPDWRGYGATEWPPVDCYWFADYLADLDAILKHYSPDQAINLVGHSMGGNIALLYAGIRPHRIHRLVNLEGLGLPDNTAAEVPQLYANWLDMLASGTHIHLYDSLDKVAARLQKNNPRLSTDKAQFLAQHWARPTAEGQWEICGAPAHKIRTPIAYHLEDAQACWANISAPVLHVEGIQTEARLRLTGSMSAQAMANFRQRFDVIAHRQDVLIDQAGHMVHHDQPEKIAQLIENFCIQI